MTLIEKFENYFDPKWLNKETSAHYCEKIADEYAIEFSQWVLDRFTFKDYIHKELSELLEIFKKEKGL